MIQLKPELVQGLDTPDGIRRAVQAVIELEHAAMPPYVYALYSLSENEDIHQILKGILVDEMGHVALACNVLNAIGGSPVLDSPGFVPAYPGPLPGAAAGSLTVPLAPFSLDLVRDVFMQIEGHDDPSPVAGASLTIPRFYAAVADAIRAAGSSIFTGDRVRQVEGNPSGAVTAVTDADTAATALGTIVDQDSGTTRSPETLEEGKLAHHYLFASIVNGRWLVKDAGGQWSFSGDAIPFDPAGVVPQVENPKASDYPPGSDAAHANDVFNASYTTLLNALQTAFNTDGGTVSGTIRKMFMVRGNAGTLAATPFGDHTFAGPTFDREEAGPIL